MEFQVGDRVMVSNSACYPELNSCCGTVACRIRGHFGTAVYGIEFDRPLSELTHDAFSGHDCGGRTKRFYGWNLPAKDLIEAPIDLEVDLNSLI